MHRRPSKGSHPNVNLIAESHCHCQKYATHLFLHVVSDIFVPFWKYLDYLVILPYESLMSNFAKICQVGAELIRADRHREGCT